MFNRLREDIGSVFHRDPAARNAFEVLTNYPGLHALMFHRMDHRLWCWGFKWLARTLSTLARWFTGIEIHPGASIGRRFSLIMAWASLSGKQRLSATMSPPIRV